MTPLVPPRSEDICQRLLRGYQFSTSDSASDSLGALYTTLDESFAWFHHQLQVIGFTLVRDGEVILLEKEQKELTNDERQTVVALLLLVDLWLEQGGSYADLYSVPVRWVELHWLRDGYGREYLTQVALTDLESLEELWQRVARKGLVRYDTETRTLTLRAPAGRIVTMARRIHQQLRSVAEDRDA